MTSLYLGRAGFIRYKIRGRVLAGRPGFRTDFKPTLRFYLSVAFIRVHYDNTIVCCRKASVPDSSGVL